MPMAWRALSSCAAGTPSGEPKATWRAIHRERSGSVWGKLIWARTKGAPGFKPAAQLLQSIEALLARHEMHGQNAGGGVEGTFGRGLDVTFVQPGALGVGAERLRGQPQHGRRGIDAIEGPLRMGVGKGPELQTATGAENQHPSGIGHALCQQQRRHAQQAGIAGNLPRRAFGVGSGGMLVEEG